RFFRGGGPTLAQQTLALGLVEAAPDAVAFLDLDGVVEALLPDLAAAAQCAGHALAEVLLRLALEMAGREEVDGVLPPALRRGAPRGVVVHPLALRRRATAVDRGNSAAGPGLLPGGAASFGPSAGTSLNSRERLPV